MAQPESQLRARCRMFLNTHLVAPCWFSAIEHGRKHSGTAEQRARQWQHLAAQGVKPGIGDMLILIPGRAIWIELKAGKNTQSNSQIAMQADMAAIGHGYVVVRCVVALMGVMDTFSVPMHPGARNAAEMHDMALAVPDKPRKPARPRAIKPGRRAIEAGNRMALAMARGPK